MFSLRHRVASTAPIYQPLNIPTKSCTKLYLRKFILCLHLVMFSLIQFTLILLTRVALRGDIGGDGGSDVK